MQRRGIEDAAIGHKVFVTWKEAKCWLLECVLGDEKTWRRRREKRDFDLFTAVPTRRKSRLVDGQRVTVATDVQNAGAP